MKTMKTLRSLGASVAVAATIVSALASSPALAADEAESPEQIANLVAEAAAVAAPTPQAITSEAVAVEVPADPNELIQLTPVDGPALAVSLPTDLDVSRGVTTADGTVVYAAADSGVDVTVEALPNGARVSTVLNEASTERSFEYDLPDGVEAESDEDGRIVLSKEVEVEAEGSAATVSAVVGFVEPAWAIDASGQEVATFYEIMDGSIVQHVETTDATVYPVVADPTWSATAWNQLRIRWNRAETATIAAGGWGATGVTAVCIAGGAAIGGPPAGAALGAVCLGLSGSAVYTAGVAQNSKPKRCLEMFATYTFVVGVGGWIPWFGHYAGGTCK